MSISKKMDKYTAVYLYKGILHSHKKTDIESRRSLDKLRYYLEQIKLDTQSTYHMNPCG